MDVIPLSQLRLGIQYSPIRVMISRLWEFRGKSDDEPVKHLDLVIIDDKETAIYVEIPAEVIEVLKTNLVEGRVVTIKKFVVQHTKTLFKVVQHPYMIKLNRRTEIIPVHPQPQNFPRHVYSLISFSDLNHYLNMTTQFLDVIGQIIAVSDAATVKSFGKIQTKRIVKLKDLSDQIIEVSLWGSTATKFQGEEVYKVGQKDAVIILFVGTFWKSQRGETPFLSATSACHWYINDESIPEIRNFYASLPNEVEPIEKLLLPTNTNNQDEVKQKTLLELKDVDVFEEKTNQFECTVTITRLTPNQRWYYTACPICHSRTNFNGVTHTCTNKDCSCTQMEHRYKLSLMGSDDTFELEFILFETRAQQLIGKPCKQLQIFFDKADTPPEILSLIGQKYTFIVKVSVKSVDRKIPCFEVIYIKEQFGKQTKIPTIQQDMHAIMTRPTADIQMPTSKSQRPMISFKSFAAKSNSSKIQESSNYLAQLQLADNTMDIEPMVKQTRPNLTGSKRSYDSTMEDTEDDDDELGTYDKRSRQ